MSASDGTQDYYETLVSVPLDRTEAKELLASWRCCGSPNLCGARCMDDEESHRLAQFAEFIDNEQANNSGLARELGDTRAQLAAVEASLSAIREWAECNYGGVKRPIDIWPGLAAALGATDQAGDGG